MTTSPLDTAEGPDHLVARVVDRDAEGARIHGYAVEDDLARHYPASVAPLLALTGELPDEATTRAFELATWLAAPASVAEAPGHAAILAKIVGARASGALAIAALGLAEQAREIFADTERALELDELTTELRARSDAERGQVARLAARLTNVPLLARGPRLDVAIFAVWRACGLTTAEALGAAWVSARLPVIVAEASAYKVGDIRSYPTNLPCFEYEATR